MSLHRCAVCGSKNVITDTQSGGVSYNYKKGIVGTAVLGAGGAVAGIENKSQQIFICQDCGITLTYEMPESFRNAIDKGLISENARNFLYVDGGQLSWSVLKKQFKNIEEGPADRLIAARENRSKEGLLSYATATKEEFDNAVDLIVDFERRFSYNGSIYGQLPDDAFSDEKPMTLMEYFLWQDAIALFIENVAKYLPYPLTQYRGLSEYNMLEYFFTYLCEKIRVEYGHYPVFNDYRESDDFKNYASINPFVLYFADKYFQRTWIPFGTVDTKVIPWESDNFGKDIARQHALRHCLSHQKFIYKFKNNENKEITIFYTQPRYIVKDGRLGFWRESNRRRLPDAADTMEDYFSIYPEKRKEFDAKVAGHNYQITTYKNELERKTKKYENDLLINASEIKSLDSQIQDFENRFFFAKRYRKQAEPLKEDLDKLKAEQLALEKNISVLKKQINEIVDDRTFYKNLVQEMDYFIVLRYVDDDNRIPFYKA